MATTVDAVAIYEVRSVNRFLQAKGHSTLEINWRISIVYGENCVVVAVMLKLQNVMADSV